MTDKPNTGPAWVPSRVDEHGERTARALERIADALERIPAGIAARAQIVEAG